MPEGPGPAEGPSLADLGEAELIRRLGAFAPAGQFDDDAAVLDEAGDRRLIVNTDVLVDGVHFSDATTPPVCVGWRAAAANLSDLAAMGCHHALGLTVGLVAPPTTPWTWVEEVYRGIAATLEIHGGTLLGGDCSSGGQRLLAITALGRLGGGGDGLIRRGDGHPGDRLISTGPHGLSRLGLALLQETVDTANMGEELRHRAIEAHQRPRPRFDAVVALAAARPAGEVWRVGGCDSSDGLVAAVQAIAAASRCCAELDPGDLPMDPAMAALPMAESWCLTGGEDFELVLALQPAWAGALLGALPGSRAIGRLVDREPAGTVSWRGRHGTIRGGFSHFS